MAYPLVVNSLLKARVWCTQAEQAAVNTLFYFVSSITGAPTTDLDVAKYIDSFLNGRFKAVIGNDATYRGVQVSVQNVSPLPATQFYNGNAAIGTGGAIDLPRQTCGLLQFQTANAGRRFRGRWYLPFPATTADVAGGLPSSTYLTAAQSIASALLTNLSAPNASATGVANLVPCLQHRPGISPLPANVTNITTISVSTKWATQRRRGSFGRANSSPI